MRPSLLCKRGTEAYQGDLCTDGISYSISRKLTSEQQLVLWFWKPPQLVYLFNYLNTFYVSPQSSCTGRLYLLCTEYRPSSWQPQKALFSTIPLGSAGQRLQPPVSTRLPLTHIAFQKIYLEPCTSATRGKGKRSEMDTIMADIKAATLNTWAHRFVYLVVSFWMDI